MLHVGLNFIVYMVRVYYIIIVCVNISYSILYYSVLIYNDNFFIWLLNTFYIFHLVTRVASSQRYTHSSFASSGWWKKGLLWRCKWSKGWMLPSPRFLKEMAICRGSISERLNLARTWSCAFFPVGFCFVFLF